MNMKKNMKKMICITGADGTGKSTVIKNLSLKFPKSQVVSIWDLLKNPKHGPKIGFKSKSDADEFLKILNPVSRTLFLFFCLHEAFVIAQKGDADFLILDSYWYKYYISELVYGADKNILQPLTTIFPKPDVTIYLYLDVAISTKRKETFSGYELGNADVNSSKIENSTIESSEQNKFLAFQKKMLPLWDDQCISNSWVAVCNDGSEEETTNKVLEIIKQYVTK